MNQRTARKQSGAAPVSASRLVAATLAPVVVASAVVLQFTAPGDSAFLGYGLLALVGAVALARPFGRAGAVFGLLGAMVYVGFLAFRFGIGPVIYTPAAAGSLALVVIGLLGEVLARLMRTAEERGVRDAVVIDELSERDILSGALRRRNADRFLGDEVERARRYVRNVALIVVGFDEWPTLVRSDGPQAAERLIGLAGQTLVTQVRTSDRVGRHDEGEFSVILPETSRNGGEIAARKLVAALAQATGLTPRAGVAEFPTDAIRSDDLVQEAEAALEFAQAAGFDVASGRILDSQFLGQDGAA